jgi:hypothetical protein
VGRPEGLIAARRGTSGPPANTLGNNEVKKLFIVGCPRSGTTMLQQALDRHPRIIIPPETGYFFYFLGHTLKAQRCQLRRITADLGIDPPPLPRRISRADDAIAFYEELASRYCHLIGQNADGCEYFGEKTPDHLLCIRRIHRLFPDARFVLIHRDGRDVALSLTKVPWSPPDYYINFAIWLRFARAQQRAMAMKDLALRCVRYEDLVEDPQAELRRITGFLGVEYTSSMAEGKGRERGVPEWERGWKSGALDQINDSRVAVWRRELATDQLKHVERWGGDVLQALGYPLATDRAESLPLWFFPRLYGKHTLWRAQAAVRIARKELLGESSTR